MLEAHAHQDLPFEQLVHELQPERSQTSTPLFQALFSLEARAQESLRLGGVHAAPLAGALEAAKFDLSLAMGDGGGRIGGSLIFRTDLFDGATIDRMVEHLRLLLEAAAADPDARLASLSLLGEAERGRVLGEWKARAHGVPARRVHREHLRGAGGAHAGRRGALPSATRR